jgi:hypothetical protein
MCDNKWNVRAITGNVRNNKHALVFRVGLLGRETVVVRVVRDVLNACSVFFPHEP